MPNLNLRGAARDVCCVERRAWAIHVVRRGGELGREGEGRSRDNEGGMRRALELRVEACRTERVFLAVLTHVTRTKLVIPIVVLYCLPELYYIA